MVLACAASFSCVYYFLRSIYERPALINILFFLFSLTFSLQMIFVLSSEKIPFCLHAIASILSNFLLIQIYLFAFFPTRLKIISVFVAVISVCVFTLLFSSTDRSFITITINIYQIITITPFVYFSIKNANLTYLFLACALLIASFCDLLLPIFQTISFASLTAFGFIVISTFYSVSRLIKKNVRSEHIQSEFQSLMSTKTQFYEHEIYLSQVRHDESRRLIHSLDSSLERERKSISMRLHDDIGATLTNILWRLRSVKTSLDLSKTIDRSTSIEFADIVISLNNVYESVRDISKNLTPEILVSFGLKVALNSLANEYNKANHFKTFVSVDDLDGLSPETNLTLYRIVQEGITNIIKHANASEAYIILKFDHDNPGYLTLSIIDNGDGFDVSKKPGTGLLGMREKAKAINGECFVESDVGHGSTITIQFPGSIQL